MLTFKRGLVAILAATAVLCQIAVADDEIDAKNPVRSADEDEIKSLPGLNYTLNFKHYSGYLEADKQNPTNRFWHYWFVESQSDPSKDPLVLWLNGGPGCSSLLGLWTELGPYRVNSDGMVTDNIYSWNKKANILFLESPAGVGYSYAVDGSVIANDDSTAKQNHQALTSFFKKFPQYKQRPLYLTGESYGGVYLPTLASLVDDDKEMNLKGVAIGNGYLDANKLAESLVFYSYYHGLIGRTTWEGLSQECCAGSPPSRGGCKFTDSQRPEKCSKFVTEATDAILESGLNPYNIYDHCANPATLNGQANGQTRVYNREIADKSLLRHAFNQTRKRVSFKFDSKYMATARSKLYHARKFKISLRGDPPCTDDSIIINYLNRDDVRKAIHIPGNLQTKFTTCFDGIQYTMIYPFRKDGLAPFIKKLLDSDRKINILVYNGDTDMMCNYLGDEWFVDDLGRKVISEYTPWHVNGQVAGFVKHFEGISYMTVKGSGHMVPTDKPAEAAAMFDVFLYGHKK